MRTSLPVVAGLVSVLFCAAPSAGARGSDRCGGKADSDELRLASSGRGVVTQAAVHTNGCSAIALRSRISCVLSDSVPSAFAFRYRSSGPRTRQLLSLPSNGVVVRHERRTVKAMRRGAALVAVRRGHRRWTRVGITVDAQRRRLTLKVDGSTRTVRLPSARSERRIVIGAGSGRRASVLYADDIRTGGSGVTCAPSATPAPMPALSAPSSGSAESGRPDPSTTPTAGGDVSAPAAPQASADAAPSGEATIFAPDSVWNQPLPDGASLSSRSAAYVQELERQLSVYQPWINTGRYSVPVFRVPAEQPGVRVVLDTSWSLLQEQWESVPMPLNAKPAEGTDGHLVLYQAATDTLWEFYRLKNVDGVWHARWGGRIPNASSSPGYYSGPERHHGATATSLSLFGGLIMADELRAGRIDHALAMAIPEARSDAYAWPAQRADGSIPGPAAIPEGTRFRIDPDVDLDALDMPPLVRMMAEAAQRYGIIVRDTSADVTFYAEDRTPWEPSPYYGAEGFFGGDYPNNLLRRFPWEHLQVIDAPLHGPGAANGA